MKGVHGRHSPVQCCTSKASLQTTIAQLAHMLSNCQFVSRFGLVGLGLCCGLRLAWVWVRVSSCRVVGQVVRQVNSQVISQELESRS